MKNSPFTNKKILSFSFIFISYSLWIFSALSSPAENSPTQNQTQLENQTPNELLSIDLEIDSLNKELARIRKEALNQEVYAQQFMKVNDWHEFTENVGDAENNEKLILEIKEKIKKLNDRKKILLKQSSHQN